MLDRLYHKAHLWAQRRQSWAKRDKDPSFRTLRYLKEIREWMPGLWPWPEPVLCLGPRNDRELAYLRQAEMQSVIGLDLFSQHPDILVGDMHAMTFPDNQFGTIWASHVLEHSRDLSRVLGEISRVAKPGGWLVAAWPTAFPPNWHDRDLGHPDAVAMHLPGGQVLMSLRYEAGGSAEYFGLFRINK